MIELLVVILVLLIVLGMIMWALSYAPIPPPSKGWVYALVILIFAIVILYAVFGRDTSWYHLRRFP